MESRDGTPPLCSPGLAFHYDLGGTTRCSVGGMADLYLQTADDPRASSLSFTRPRPVLLNIGEPGRFDSRPGRIGSVRSKPTHNRVWDSRSSLGSLSPLQFISDPTDMCPGTGDLSDVRGTSRTALTTWFSAAPTAA